MSSETMGKVVSTSAAQGVMSGCFAFHPRAEDFTLTHRCPKPGNGTMPCCGRTPFEVSPYDRMTVDEALVTCIGEGVDDEQ